MDHEASFQELTKALAACPAVEALALGGSRATGSHDAASDYDLYVYLAADLPVSRRQELYGYLFATMEWDNRYWETEDDGVFHDGVAVDILFRTIDWLGQAVRHKLRDALADTGYTTCLWHNLLHSRILFDRQGRLEALRAECDVDYPRALQAAIIAKNRPLLDGSLPAFRDQIAKAMQRGDQLSVNHRTAAFFASLFDILFALNGLSHPGEKRMLSLFMARAKLVPAGLADDVATCLAKLHVDGKAALATIDRICKATETLLVTQGW